MVSLCIESHSYDGTGRRPACVVTMLCQSVVECSGQMQLQRAALSKHIVSDCLHPKTAGCNIVYLVTKTSLHILLYS